MIRFVRVSTMAPLVAAASLASAACEGGGAVGRRAAPLVEGGAPPDGIGDGGAPVAAPEERFRPRWHFTPPFGWMNDPNGLVFADGIYHLFFQYNPYATDFGNIGWGHSVSTDFVHWQTWPVALSPTPDTFVFSGGAVVDPRNTSGLCTPEGGGPACIVTIYTANRFEGPSVRQTQDLAVSTDGARTFRRFEGNPVLDRALADFRDPKVFWHEPTQRWVMAVALPLERRVALYGSPDLRSWQLLSEFGPLGATGGVWECPELMELPVEGGGEGERAWVMKVDLNPGHKAGGSGGQYFVGTFDGTTFAPSEPTDAPLWIDHGADFYCATTYDNLRSATGERAWIGWMNDWRYATRLPTFPWRGTMVEPRWIALTRTTEGLRLRQRPHEAIASLRGPATSFTGTDPARLNEELAAAPLDLESFELRARGPADAPWAIELVGSRDASRVRVAYVPERSVFEVFREAAPGVEVPPEFPATHEAPIRSEGDSVELGVLVDRDSVEVFADGGTSVITDLHFIEPVRLRVVVPGDLAGRAVALDHWPLASAR